MGKLKNLKKLTQLSQMGKLKNLKKLKFTTQKAIGYNF